MRSSSIRRILLAIVSVGMLGLAGCGGDAGPPRAPVEGTVMHNGSPVTGGSLTFSPIAGGQTEAGKPATGTVQPDGAFTLGTNKPGDGAVIGKHRVNYSPPDPEAAAQAPADGSHAEGPPPSPYAGLVPETKEVEVTSGENNITIELVKP